MNSEVTLTGRLVCADDVQAQTVREYLPAHIALTRAEPGCLSFEVHPSDDPLIWTVDETYIDAPSFRAHQARTADSAWGNASAAVAREYTITGLADDA